MVSLKVISGDILVSIALNQVHSLAAGANSHYLRENPIHSDLREENPYEP
jgi:hypothetical protein